MDNSDEIEVARVGRHRGPHVLQPHASRRRRRDRRRAPGGDGGRDRRRRDAVVVYRALNGRSGARYSEGVSGGAHHLGPDPLELVHAASGC